MAAEIYCDPVRSEPGPGGLFTDVFVSIRGTGTAEAGLVWAMTAGESYSSASRNGVRSKRVRSPMIGLRLCGTLSPADPGR